MAKVLKEAELTTAKARSRLPIGEHARRLDAEAHLFYRKGVRSGVWFVRWRNHAAGANYRQMPVGPANDINDKPTEGLLTFLEAERLGRSHVEAARAEAKAIADGPLITVRSAVETYVAKRDARETARKGREGRSDANRRLSRHLLGQEKRGKQPAIQPDRLADVALHAIKDKDLTLWLASLPQEMKGTTRQRLVNDIRAALNAAYAAHRDRLPPTLPGIVKHAFAARTDDGPDEETETARDNQVLKDADVTRLIRAAQEIDGANNWEGDLFRLVLVLAATGARFSQITRMKVRDVQRDKGRLMVPTSRKGRGGGKTATTPVPVGRDVLDVLLPITTGRPSEATLLERWRVQQIGPAEWERTGRGPWVTSSELRRPWIAITEKAKMPGVIPYALRHSSIVRGIRANLPIRLVAAVHNTSVAMIERHYAKWIATGLEELVAQAVVPLVPENSGRIVSIFDGK